jgi:uncharacterized protein YcbX
MRVISLNIHPVKGMRAHSKDRARLGLRGLEGDRRWLAVDDSGRFITQRSHPRLATITATPTSSGLELSAAAIGTLQVEIPSGEERATVTVWEDTVSAAVAAASAHEWLSSLFGESLRLVYMDARSDRQKRGLWVTAPVPVSFADAYPVLAATTGSLDAINREIVHRGGEAVPMARFRPNIVIDCGDAWAEDRWRVLRIGEIELDLVKPCDRCIVTTTDQSTGERMGKEPLASLARIRRSADPRINGVLFAWNAIPRVQGEIAVGDVAEVLTERPEGFPLRTGDDGEIIL